MAFCPADCADITVIPNNPGGCDLNVRKRSIDRIGFFPCSVDLPSPFTCAGLQGLVDANTLTFSSPLANIEVQDPTFEELQISDCRPADRIAVSRIINFQDRIAIDIPAVTGEDPVPANPFFDYDFWKDKKTKRTLMRYLFVFCDGSVVVPRDESGKPLSASLDVFLSYERQGNGSNSYILEIKKGQLQFKGDPLDFTKPELTADNEIFYLSDCGII
jgi:hypothetical protein